MSYPNSNCESEYDVIIIGAGAGGGVVAGVLAETGKRVLLLERGRMLRYADDPRDHLRNHRLSLYGHNTGPALDGNPRVFVDVSGRRVLRPHEDAYSNNASAVGGGTLVYGAQAWRFMPQDFRMAEIYGVPEGSSLADWPITYEDLEPYYDRAEWEIGVSGEAKHFAAGPRRRGYPMPPVPDNPQRNILRRAADRLGWQTAAVPLLINTTEYNGRPACIRCGNCIGHICPSDSKNGTQNTMIARALASGNCELVTQTMVQHVETDTRGKVTGVTYFADCDTAPRLCTARAKKVILSAGAIETVRLLLNSASDQHPRGLGNQHDQVGRNLQGHYYPGAFARLDEITYDGFGPGVSIATCRFNHANPGIIGGGMLANEFIKTPIAFYRNSLPPGLPRWGAENKKYMRENYTRSIHVTGPVQEIPSANDRVTVDPSVRDKWGIPVAVLSGNGHPVTVVTAEFMRQRARMAPGNGSGGGLEQQSAAAASQCRATSGWDLPDGRNPANSVTDSFGRVHGHDNLFIADASLHVTNGGFNPVLTIMALAFRVADSVLRM